MLGVGLIFEGSPDATLQVVIATAAAAALLAVGLGRLLSGRGGAWPALAAVGGPASLFAALAIATAASSNPKRYLLPLTATGALVAAAAVVLWGSPDPHTLWTVVAAGWVVTAVGVFYADVFGELGAARLAALTVLRTLAVAAVAGLLFKPTMIQPVDETVFRPGLTVLVDRSASMAAIDYPGLPNRYEQAVGALVGCVDRLADSFDVRYRSFAEGVRDADDLADLRVLAAAGPGADGTRLAAALTASAPGRSAEPSAGLLVFSDGLQTGSDDARAAAATLGSPVYTIIVGAAGAGSGEAAPNASIESVVAPPEAISDNLCTVTARVRAAHLTNQLVRVRLRQDGFELAEHTFAPTAADVTEVVKLSFVPGSANVAADGDASRRRLSVHIDEIPGESSVADNVADVHLFVGAPQIRVLYVESIRPEYKFLSRQLRSDPNVQLITLVRLSADTFVVNGSIGGRSLSALPDAAEEWDLFDVVIIGDVDSSVWTAAQLDRLARFVRAGNGLAMLGGAAALGPGGYGDTPVQDVLPVRLGGRDIGGDSIAFVPQLTADGLRHPMMAGTQQFMWGPAGREPELTLPPLTGCVRTVGLTGGATALAIHPTAGAGERIVLAVRSSGKGRSLVFTPFTTWQWRLQLAARGADDPYGRFWRQMVRYLADVETRSGAAPAAVIGRVARRCFRVGDTVSLAAFTRGLDDPAVSVEIVPDGQTGAATRTIRLVAAGAGAEGVFEAAEPGSYTLRFAARAGAGAHDVHDEISLTVAPYSPETERTGRDDALLAEVARVSGGRSAELENLTQLVDVMVSRSREMQPAMTAAVVRLYDFTWGFVLFVTIITIEWILRRRWQLR